MGSARGHSAVVERRLAKVDIAGSSPFNSKPAPQERSWSGPWIARWLSEVAVRVSKSTIGEGSAGSGSGVAGNTRLKAARLLGHDRPVVRFEGTDSRARPWRRRQQDARHSTWDQPLLAKLSRNSAPELARGTGFSDGDIDSLIAELEAQQGPVELDDQVPGTAGKSRVAHRHLWLLGGHRLLYGDEGCRRRR